MSNVIVDKNKIDILANAISVKSGEPVTMTLDEMVSAVDGIETPTGNIDITQAGTTDVTNYATATVPQGSVTGISTSATQMASNYNIGVGLISLTGSVPTTPIVQRGYVTSVSESSRNVTLRISYATNPTPTVSGATVTTPVGIYTYAQTTDVASGTEGTPTATKGTVSNHSVSVTPSVTNSAGYISGGTHNGTAVSVSASELVSGTYTVDSSGTKDVTNYASASVPSGTAGTPSASKGTVSNHSVTVTPSVTNQTGWITGSTKTGTGVTVSASELASGNKEITQNGSNIDVVGYSTVSVNVSGGGGSSVSVGTKTATLSSASSSISFTGLSGEPTSFAVTSSTDQSTGGTKVVSVVYDGTSCLGMDITTQASNDTGFTQSYSNGTLTITATTAQFQANEYKLVYSYGGGASNIGTADVQVGSGATSITFTGLEDEPIAWSCIFKSTFSTSSGYQRVMEVVYDGTSTYGHALDSSAHALTSWSYTYNNGSLTITSTGTNNGGYFHQPGYYQLTYVIGEASPYEKVSKTYRASTTAQSEKIEPSTGYDAMSEVNISIPAVSQTNLVAGNIKSGTTVTISNGSTNLWSVTGTYSGGGSGGGLTLLKTISLGEMATTSTTAVDAHKSVTLENSAYNAYDVLILDISVDTQVNGHHTSTVSMIYVTGQSDVSNKGTFAVGSNKWNSKLSSLGVASTRNATSSYGIYANSVSVSNGTMTIPLYYRSSSQATGTLDGTYTARVYGLNLYDMIGG